MTVCKYFLRGNCRFGNQCRFEHPANNQDSFGFNQRGNTFVSNNYQDQTGRYAGRFPNKDMKNDMQIAQEYVESVIQEIKVWDTSGMWPFSCIAYAKDSKCLPGFDDISAEELRLDAYDSHKSNTFSLHKEKVVQLENDFKTKRSQLKNSNAQMKQKLLQEILNLEKSKSNPAASASSSASSNLAFGAGSSEIKSAFQNVGSVFGGGTNEKIQHGLASAGSVFGGNSSSSAVSNNLFTQNRFGALNDSSSTSQPTGGSTSSVLSQFSFAPQQSQSSSFGGQSTQAQTGFGSGHFGSGAIQPSKSVFGQAAGSTPTTNVFGQSAQVSANPMSNSVFGQSKPDPAFASSQTFGNSQVAGNTSAFGKSLTNTNQSQPPAQKSNVYSDLNSLTAEQKEQFEAERFILGRIPMIPPPIELV